MSMFHPDTLAVLSPIVWPYGAFAPNRYHLQLLFGRYFPGDGTSVPAQSPPLNQCLINAEHESPAP